MPRGPHTQLSASLSTSLLAAYPGERLYVHVPKLNENEVLVPCSLALRFDIAGCHTNTFLVQNVAQALVEKLVEETVDYDIYKTFGDLFLSEEKRNNMVPDGDSERGLLQDPLKFGEQENLGRRSPLKTS